MKSQAVLIETLIVFILVVFFLFLTVPVHQDIYPLVGEVVENDVEQVKRLLWD